MAQTALRPWTLDEFFAWQERQEDKYELVEGVPVRMMSGARAIHDRIVVNLIGELRTGLRGGPCRPFTADSAVQTGPARIRRPDAGVDCGPFDPDSFKAVEPRLVAEVLSPSTRDVDTLEKIAEYKAIPTLSDILVIEPNAPDIIHWSRREGGEWTRSRIEGLDGAAEIESLGLTLPLAALYEGLPAVSPDAARS